MALCRVTVSPHSPFVATPLPLLLKVKEPLYGAPRVVNGGRGS
jgi:hypothetical protein